MLVTGASGQDGSYLCERLVGEGATVHAIVEDPTDAAALEFLSGTHVHGLDLRDSDKLAALVADTAPDEVYNLAGMSSVGRSWNRPVLTAQVNAAAVAVLLAACRDLQERHGTTVRVVQASSAEIFGNSHVSPQDESTRVSPTNPYGAAKAYAHHLVGVYRGWGVHASSVILYNHESPRRPQGFVTRAITHGVARIAAGISDHLTLGSLDTRRDWGWAPDYVDGMVRAARHPNPTDVILATGTTHSIGDFVEAALTAAGVAGGLDRVRIDPGLARPVDTHEQRGDASRARELLGWSTTLGFTDIVTRMVVADVALLRRTASHDPRP